MHLSLGKATLNSLWKQSIFAVGNPFPLYCLCLDFLSISCSERSSIHINLEGLSPTHGQLYVCTCNACSRHWAWVLWKERRCKPSACELTGQSQEVNNTRHTLLCPKQTWATSVIELLLESLPEKLRPGAVNILRYPPASSVPWAIPWHLKRQLHPTCCQTLQVPGSFRYLADPYVLCFASFQMTQEHLQVKAVLGEALSIVCNFCTLSQCLQSH